MTTVTLYGREGCHLCDEAREQLLRLRGSAAEFELVEVDIDSDDRLLRELLELIPVVEVEGRRIGELGFADDALLAALATFGA